jgi:hypothetical protein
VKRLLAATCFACTVAAGGCSSGDDRSLNLDDLRNAEAPYYYVGSSFEGQDVSYIFRYRAGKASIDYGTCDLLIPASSAREDVRCRYSSSTGCVTASSRFRFSRRAAATAEWPRRFALSRRGLARELKSRS